MHQPTEKQANPAAGGQLATEASLLSEKCIDCKLCRKECAFLRKYGSPKGIAEACGSASAEDLSMAFECSLCKLCAAVCPVGLDPAGLFLEMRRASMARGAVDVSRFGRILKYEKRGISRRYSYYALPEGCDTVLFPGCTLSGTRPARVRQLYAHMLKTIPRLGLVLDCCASPSRSLGREEYFQAVFGEMKEYLLKNGVRNVLTACPNCYMTFQRYGDGLQAASIYEHLADAPLPAGTEIAAIVTIHDPCATRNQDHIHAAVRRLISKSAPAIREMKHHGHRTLCCGEGGSAGCINPDFSKAWGKTCRHEAHGTSILTYCAGCAHFLGESGPACHILDFLFEPEATLAGRAKVAKAPWTYINRLLLKRHFKKTIPAAISRVRTFTGAPKVGPKK